MYIRVSIFSVLLLTPSLYLLAEVVPKPVEKVPVDLVQTTNTYNLQNQKQIIETQQEQVKELQSLPVPQKSSPAKQSAQATKPSSGIGQKCYVVDRIDIKGGEHLSNSQRARILPPFTRVCMDAPQMRELVKVVTNAYLERAYVTSRAYLPEQDISQGTLSVQVIEGQLEKLSGGDMASARELAMAFPGETGTILNLRELEQLLDQLNRLPSRQAKMEVSPGKQAGGSEVTLVGERSKSWRIGTNYHNGGQESTGREQAGVSLDIDSPFGLGDQLNVRASKNMGGGGGAKNSDNHWINYSVPYGFWTMGLSYSHSSYISELVSSNVINKFKSTGRDKVFTAQLERLMHRDDVSKTSMSVAINHIKSRNYMHSTSDNGKVQKLYLKSSSHRITENVWGMTHGRRIGSGFMNLGFNWHRGTGALDAQGDNHPRGNTPDARFNKYSATASYFLPFNLFKERWSYESLAFGQRSQDVLYSPQRITVGGLYSVRGYKRNMVSGDSGGYWRNQFNWIKPIQTPWAKGLVNEFSVGLAYDAGVIENRNFNHSNKKENNSYKKEKNCELWPSDCVATSGHMSGGALEFKLKGQYLTSSITFAQSIKRSRYIDRERPIYFRIELNY